MSSIRIDEALRWLGSCETAAGNGSAVQKCIQNAMFELGDPRFVGIEGGTAVRRSEEVESWLTWEGDRRTSQGEFWARLSVAADRIERAARRAETAAILAEQAARDAESAAGKKHR